MVNLKKNIDRYARLVALILLGCFPANAAPDQSSEKTIIFAVGLTQHKPDPASQTILSESVTLFPHVDFRPMPLERAYRRFAANQVDCTIADLSWASETTLVGARFFDVNYSLYKRAGGASKGLDQAVISKLSISATRDWPKEKLPGATFISAPNVDVLAAMLLSGRVDYVLAADVGFGRLPVVLSGQILRVENSRILHSDPNFLLCQKRPDLSLFVQEFSQHVTLWRERGLLPD
ncbi:MAG: ABC transporter substrate-binding protein [Alphaproteobacteria bacterium]|nr:ABC transporter substrate-binding protein [Alphaproteobacteria bacterium]